MEGKRQKTKYPMWNKGGIEINKENTKDNI